MPHLYLLCFSKRLAHAKHYLGFTERAVDARIREHRGGRGSPLVAAAVAAGIKLTLTWTKEVGDDGRCEERRIKNRGTLARLCPKCKPARRRAERIAVRQRRAKTHRKE